MSDVISHNPPGLFSPYAGYAHAVEVPPGARTLFISGLNLYEPDGMTMPRDFAGQARLIWRHLGDHRSCRTVVVQQTFERPAGVRNRPCARRSTE